MRGRSLFIFAQAICLALLLLGLHTIEPVKSGEISTVFVLETDSSGQQANNQNLPDQHNTSNKNNHTSNHKKQAQSEDSKVITDEAGGPSVNTAHGPTEAIDSAKQQQAVHKQQSTDSLVVIKRNPNHSQTNSGQDADRNISRDRENLNRKLDDSPSGGQRSSTSRQNGSQTSHHHQQAQHHQQTRPRSTTTSSSYDREASGSATTPKTEERLLISIVSDEDINDSNLQKQNPKPSHGIIGSSSNLDDSEETLQKRKPSITIAIHDSSINKHNGGSGSSGTPALIVRPTENGQIVISTGGSIESTGDKYNQHNKPHGNHGNQQQDLNHQINGQHGYLSSTTFRPSLVSDFNQPSPAINPPINSLGNQEHNNRPITSTLIDGPLTQPHRPPTSGTYQDERPQSSHGRPSITSSSGTHEPSRPILSDERPPRPPISNEYGQSGNNNYEPAPSSRPTHRPSSYEESGDSNRPIGIHHGESKYPLNEKDCGLVHETRIVGGDEADPNDFLWMAAIIRSKQVNGEARPFCGGSLITRRHIMTAAHCLENLAPRDVLVRLGSYDFDETTASSASADYAIDQFRVPANYSKKTHVADIAIMRLKTPLSPNDNYKTVCMPQPRRSYVGTLATVTGYGSQKQTFRSGTPKLRQVTVPIWENRKCSLMYKKNLTESFLCAGYEEGGKDACQGDSGGPLMTEGPNDRMMVVGVVSHGIGCGSPGYPGVYTRTSTFLEWIEKNTRE